jgi:NAD(P) transhydrogenase subunit alpha
MKIAVLRETRAGESRVAASPETVKKFIVGGAEFIVERGAGESCNFPDHAFQEAGATIAANAAEAISAADLVLKVRAPDADDFGKFRPGQRIAAIVNPHGAKDVLDAAASAGVELFAMDLMPRITRAQSMDVLSSQSNLAGYKAVIDASAYYGRAMPMMMTAAGTIAPAKVFIMGAGVAGLQAIATCRRLGAVVAAYDLRPEAHDEISSLGARAIEAPLGEATEGGYAKETTEAFARRQLEALTPHVTAADVVITAAQVPGRSAPRLVTREMVETMNPAAVIVDMAAADGGNCELSRPGETTEHGGVRIFAPLDLPSRVARDASQLYARNVQAFAELLVQDEPEAAAREILESSRITHGGEVVHPITRELLGGEVTS